MKSISESWPIMEGTSTLTCVGKQRQVPPILKDIGLGASLYLLVLKAFSYYFLILSIINIPMFVIYFGSDYNTNDNSTFSLNVFFNKLSLGNIGQKGINCQEVEL